MDDCNPACQPISYKGKCVQIPLWTIVTLRGNRELTDEECSDSSMDDCNDIDIQFIYRLKISSDSSMDDCNGFVGNAIFAFQSVQIPLWTIVTHRPRHRGGE